MSNNYSYRFKPAVNGSNFSSVISLAIFGVVAYFGINLVNYFKNSMLNATEKRAGSDVTDNFFNNAALPVVSDEAKLIDIFDRLLVKLNVLFWPDGGGIVSLLSGLSKNELDWIYLKFGSRIYQHGWLSDKKDLTLFGWFDEVLKSWRKDDLVEIWSKSSYRYTPDSYSILSGFHI